MNRNIMRFELIDNTHKDEYNETIKSEIQWYGEQAEGQVLDIETFFNFCQTTARAMGFGENTIKQWFGE